MEIQNQILKLKETAEKAYQKVLEDGGTAEQAYTSALQELSLAAKELGLPESTLEGFSQLSLSSSGTVAASLESLETQLEKFLLSQEEETENKNSDETEAVAASNGLLDPIASVEKNPTLATQVEDSSSESNIESNLENTTNLSESV